MLQMDRSTRDRKYVIRSCIFWIVLGIFAFHVHMLEQSMPRNHVFVRGYIETINNSTYQFIEYTDCEWRMRLQSHPNITNWDELARQLLIKDTHNNCSEFSNYDMLIYVLFILITVIDAMVVIALVYAINKI